MSAAKPPRTCCTTTPISRSILLALLFRSTIGLSLLLVARVCCSQSISIQVPLRRLIAAARRKGSSALAVRVIVVAGRAGLLLAIDLNTGASATVDCGCAPEGLFGLGGSGYRCCWSRGSVARNRSQYRCLCDG